MTRPSTASASALSKRDFVTIADLSDAELRWIVRFARDLKDGRRRDSGTGPLAGRTIALLFQKPSLRTRVSFEVAIADLGGRAIYLSPDEVGLGKRESVADVARVLSRYVDAIVARVFAHADVEALARYASVPVINGLSDAAHPCQALADVMTIAERIPELARAVIAYVGDGNNVFASLSEAAVALGAMMRASFPTGYSCEPDVVARARARGATSGGVLDVVESPREAVRGADVVYTDVWTSMGQEEEADARRVAFAGYQIDQELMRHAGPDVLVMHCLPAHRGEEIADDVLDGPRSIVFDQAENRLHAQKALLIHLFGVVGDRLAASVPASG